MFENNNELVKIVESSGLEKTKAQYILERFQDYFKIAADWEQKSKSLTVSSVSQIAEMKMAREGRLFLRQKRLDIERARKELKEQSLREGKAIDGIANVLKGLIEPIEDFLDRQERFVEIREDESKEKRKQERIAVIVSLNLDPNLYDLKNMPEENFRSIVDGEKQAIKKHQDEEKQRVEKERLEAIERERMKKENERLQRESELKERELQKQRQEAEEKERVLREAAQKQKAEAEARERKLKAEQEAKLNKERAEREKLQSQLKAKAEAEAREKKQREDEARKAAKAPEKEKLVVLAKQIDDIQFPTVKSDEAKGILSNAKKLLNNVSKLLREAEL